MAEVTEGEEASPRQRPDALPPSSRPAGRAYRQARRHSSLVRWLRRVIPVGAVLAVGGLGAVAFLDPLGRSKAGVTLGPVSVSGTKVVMESPRLTGFRKDTRGYEVTAASAMQDVRKPTIIELKAMKGRVTVDDAGKVARMEAATGVFDTQKEQLELADDIRLWTDDGQDARLKSASVDFKAGTVVSRDPVTVTMSNGTVEADGLDVSDNGKVVSFIGRVRTVFESAGAPATGRGTLSAAADLRPVLRTERAEADAAEAGR